MLPNFCYTYIKLYLDFGPPLESYPGTAWTMRTAFWSFPFHPDEGVILDLKWKFGTWTFREEACMSDEGQSCLLKNSNSNESRVEFLTIFETGMNNLNLLCFLFTSFTFVYLSSFLAVPCEMLLGNSAFLSVLVSRYYWVHMKKNTPNINYK